MSDPKERIAALMACFDEETAADIETVILHRHAGRILGLHALVKELRDSGLATQADELLQRINAQVPQEVPALPGITQQTPNVLPSSNGTAHPPLSRRRGRPPKATGGSTS
jgi:hypothetical protein